MNQMFDSFIGEIGKLQEETRKLTDESAAIRKEVEQLRREARTAIIRENDRVMGDGVRHSPVCFVHIEWMCLSVV
jgi:FtsZ-binding cell division protein ZapB